MPHSESQVFIQFKQKIKQLLNSSSKQLQEHLIEYPVDFFIDLIYDQSENLDLRKMSCMILKMKTQKKQLIIKEKQFDRNYLLAKLQTIYMINSTNNKQLFKLQKTIELVLQKIFQVHFDDQQKCQLIENITDKISNQPLNKQQKHLSFISMLIKSMYYLTINNETIIGQMVVYLGDFSEYYSKWVINSNENLQSKVQKQVEIYEIMIKCIQIMKEIKDIVEINNEQSEDTVRQFMEGSSQLRNHLFKILKMQTVAQELMFKEQQNNNIKPIYVIWTSNHKLNKLKVEVLSIWQDIWTYHAEENLLELLIGSILTVSKTQIIDEIDSIISSCLVLLQRSCVHKDYNEIFFKMTQNLTIKLFQLISISQSEYEFMQSDPDYFIEIMDDFCKQQHLQLMKTRAGSFLANLTLAIDGYLTFVTQLGLLAMRQLQTNEQKNQIQKNLWQNFTSVWNSNQQQLIEASILILSSISDQILKRPDLKNAVLTHLIKMINLFNDPESLISKKPLLIVRYMQLYSFFSFPHCLDHFIKNVKYSTATIYKKQISKSFETMMHYYERKNYSMQIYVKQIANTIMLFGDQLTPLLEQQIMKGNKIIKNFKEKVLQKLIIWFLDAYEKQNILQINKLSTLIIKILRQNLRTQLQNDLNYLPFNAAMLKQFMVPLYRLLNIENNHPCEQAVIEIAISHVQYLYDLEQIDKETSEDFYGIGKFITEKNNLNLNNALELFNSLICPHVSLNTIKKFNQFKFDELTFEISLKLLTLISEWLGVLWDQIQTFDHRNVKSEENLLREEDLWEIYQLTEICLFNIDVRRHSTIFDEMSLNLIRQVTDKILSFSLNLSDKCQSSTMKVKIILSILQVISLNVQNFENYSFFCKMKLPNACDLPIYQCRKYCYFLLNILTAHMNKLSTEVRVSILRIIIDLIYFLQHEKLNLTNYEQKMFLLGDGVSLNAFQKYKKIHSPFDFKIKFIVHDQFRNLIKVYPSKQELNYLNEEQGYQGKIRDLVDKIIINDKPRKKFTVKRE